MAPRFTPEPSTGEVSNFGRRALTLTSIDAVPGAGRIGGRGSASESI